MNSDTLSVWNKLDADKNVVPCKVDEAEAIIGDIKARTVGYTTMSDGAVISTVFLVIRHPRDMFFETCILKPDKSPEIWARYKTYNEALIGHEHFVECYDPAMGTIIGMSGR